MNKVGYDHYWNVLQHVKVGDWELHLRQDPDEGRFFLQIQFDAIDNDGELLVYDANDSMYPEIKIEQPLVRQYCRKWYLSPHMSKSELVRTAWKAYEAAILHEAQEMFKYKGEAIYNPHIDVDAMVSIAGIHNSRG